MQYSLVVSDKISFFMTSTMLLKLMKMCRFYLCWLCQSWHEYWVSLLGMEIFPGALSVVNWVNIDQSCMCGLLPSVVLTSAAFPHNM